MLNSLLLPGLISAGIVLAAAAVAVTVDMWKTNAYRIRKLGEAKAELRSLGGLWKSGEKISEAGRAQRKLALLGVLTTVVIALLIAGYVFGAKKCFAKYHAHKYADSVTVDATCTKEGVLRRKCVYCDECCYETLPLSEHSYVETDRWAPTCAEEGYIVYTCETCGEEYTEPIEKPEHTYAESGVYAPTCAEEGYTVYTCETCGDEYTEPIEKIAHSYVEVDVREATCAEEGVIEYVCEVCGEVHTEPIEKTAHSYVETGRQEPTCAEEGFVGYVCEICGDEYTEPTEMLEHTYEEIQRQEANCTDGGFVEYICLDCGEEKIEEMPANSRHLYVLRSYTKASFFGNGYNHFVCDVCGQDSYSLKPNTFNLFTVLEILIALFTLLVCILYISDGSEDEPPFWIGLTLFILSVAFLIFHFGYAVPHQQDCGHWYTVFSDAPVNREVKEFRSNGEDTVIYEDEDEKSKRIYVEYLAEKNSPKIEDLPQYDADAYYAVSEYECAEHPSQTRYFIKMPACTEYGETLTVCDDCGAVIGSEQIEMFGHDWSGWNIEKEPELFKFGEKSRMCFTCGQIEHKSITSNIWVIILLIANIIALLSILFLRDYIDAIPRVFVFAVSSLLILYVLFPNFGVVGSIVAAVYLIAAVVLMCLAINDAEYGLMTLCIILAVLCIVAGILFGVRCAEQKNASVAATESIVTVTDETAEDAYVSEEPQEETQEETQEEHVTVEELREFLEHLANGNDADGEQTGEVRQGDGEEPTAEERAEDPEMTEPPTEMIEPSIEMPEDPMGRVTSGDIPLLFEE